MEDNTHSFAAENSILTELNDESSAGKCPLQVAH